MQLHNRIGNGIDVLKVPLAVLAHGGNIGHVSGFRQLPKKPRCHLQVRNVNGHRTVGEHILDRTVAGFQQFRERSEAIADPSMRQNHSRIDFVSELDQGRFDTICLQRLQRARQPTEHGSLNFFKRFTAPGGGSFLMCRIGPCVAKMVVNHEGHAQRIPSFRFCKDFQP